VTYAAIALFWIATATRLRSFIQAPSFINGTYALAAAAVAAGVSIKAAERAIDAATGPYVSDLLEHGVIVIAGLAAQLFLLGLRTPVPRREQTRLRFIAAAGVLLAMVITFGLAPVHDRFAGDLDAVYGALPEVVLYRLAFNGYLIYVLIDNVRLCLRYASAPGDRERTVSLTITGWASAVCLAYPLSRIAYVLIESTTGRNAEAIQTIGSAAATTGLCALAMGVLAPRALAAARRWLIALAGIRALNPLWRDLAAAFPLVTLPTPAPVTLTRAELRHDRHLLEIAEALARARVNTGSQPARASVEAIAAALAASRNGGWTADGIVAAELLPEAASPAHERLQLRALAAAYRSASAQHPTLPEEART
jgi:hypothetical protein